MNVKIPFVDLNFQHRPIQNQINSAIQSVLQNGDFILGKALTDFEKAFAFSSHASTLR